VLLAVLLVKGFLSVAATANWLQEYMNILLGPLLIIVGMFLLELLNLNLPRFGAGIDIAETAKKKGSAGTVLLGAMFALSFCPVSAALYFGTLLPLAVKNESWLFLPFVYGIGTALPVVFFGTAVATGAGYLGKAYNSVAQMELWVRRAIGVVFVCVGVWYSWTYILQA
jgi:cytochrome c biogenesis protein CcdA